MHNRVFNKKWVSLPLSTTPKAIFCILPEYSMLYQHKHMCMMLLFAINIRFWKQLLISAASHSIHIIVNYFMFFPLIDF